MTSSNSPYSAFAALLASSGKPVSPAELHGLLSRWLVNHIRNDDHDYVESVKRSMNRLAAETHEGGWLSRSLGRFFGAGR